MSYCPELPLLVFLVSPLVLHLVSLLVLMLFVTVYVMVVVMVFVKKDRMMMILESFDGVFEGRLAHFSQGLHLELDVTYLLLILHHIHPLVRDLMK